MKRSVFIIIIATLMTACPGCAFAASDAPDISAECAVVMHGGDTVFEKNADTRSLIASTTKIMTAIITIENCELDSELEVDAESCALEGSSMYLRPGQRITVEDLLYGLLLVSGNDAADALARYTAGDIESFAALMNEKAQSLGMTETSFSNPHGLDADNHYSTARDMAVLMEYCMQDEEFHRIISAPSRQIGDETIYNHNKLLWRCNGCIGGKTGYTIAAGRCLVSCCEREGTRFVCVTLSDPDDWNDHCKLYDWAFARYADKKPLSPEALPEIAVISGAEYTVSVIPAEEPTVFLPRDAELTLRFNLPRFAFAPINAGDTAGSYEIIYNGETVAAGELLYADTIPLLKRASGNLYQRTELA